MLGVHDYWTYLAGCVVIILLPGPNSLYVASVAASGQAHAGRLALAGASAIWAGDQILMLAAIFGVAALMHTYPSAFTALRWLGASYIGYLGARLIWGAMHPQKEAAEDSIPSALTAVQVFRRAFFISLSNPKAILFFMSFFIPFVEPSYAPRWHAFALLGFTIQACSVIYLLCLIQISMKSANAMRSNPKMAKWMSAGAGALFVAFGARLALS